MRPVRPKAEAVAKPIMRGRMEVLIGAPIFSKTEPAAVETY